MERVDYRDLIEEVIRKHATDGKPDTATDRPSCENLPNLQ